MQARLMKIQSPVAGAVLLSSLVLLTASASRVWGVEDSIEKRFNAEVGGKLVVVVDRGNLEITPAETNAVVVSVERAVTRVSETKARELLAQHEVTCEQSSGTVTVRARMNKDFGWWQRMSANFQVNYRVVVPRQFNLDLKTAGGNVTVADLTGEVRGHTAGGNIKLAKITGPVWVKTSGGNVSLESATGAADLRTSGGNIYVGEAQAALTADTAGGNITVQKTHANASLHTSGGSIRLDEARATVKADTSGGNVFVQFACAPPDDCLLTTSGGSVTLALPESASINLNLRTSAGRVSTELPVTVQGEQRRSALIGKLGAGGPLIKASTSGGNVRLERAHPRG